MMYERFLELHWPCAGQIFFLAVLPNPGVNLFIWETGSWHKTAERKTAACTEWHAQPLWAFDQLDLTHGLQWREQLEYFSAVSSYLSIVLSLLQILTFEDWHFLASIADNIYLDFKFSFSRLSRQHLSWFMLTVRYILCFHIFPIL